MRTAADPWPADTGDDDVCTDPDAAPWLGGALADGDFTGHLHDEHVASVLELPGDGPG